MERLTTRHNGVAVIKNKSKHKEAMEKLARIEELEEDDASMSELVEEFASYICDNICRYPYGSSQEELDKHCENCKLEKFLQDIMLKYGQIIDFDNSQCAQLMKKYKDYVLCDECEYCETSEDFGIICRFCGNKEGLDGHLETRTGCTRGRKA